MRTSKCIPSQLSLVLGIASVVAITCFTAQAVDFNLVLTEYSPTNLALSYTTTSGADLSAQFIVMNTAPDMWTITGNPIFHFNDFSNGWIEPEDPLEVNEVTKNFNTSPNQIFVHSDLSILQNTTSTPDNTPILVGGDVSSGLIFLTFHDVAQSAETAGPSVPDSGTTLGLLGLALVASLSFSRFRRVVDA